LEVNKRILRPQLFSDQRIRHILADGRNYLLLSEKMYDMIIASPSWAVELGSAGLLTDEFFELVESRMAWTGICAVWVDFFMMPHEDLEIITRTFSKHFKHTMGWYIEGDFVILIGTNIPFRFSDKEVMHSVISYRRDLLGTFNVAMSEEMVRNIPEGRINTDDRPIIEFDNARNMITWRSGVPD
ncbi:MAG: polyamine aminopropyltransferase, partial [Planctomycetota bacterium]